MPDAAKLGFAGLLGAQAKCASRLAGAICGMFNVTAEVEEFVGTRLVLEAAEWTILGASAIMCSAATRFSGAASFASRTRSGCGFSPGALRNIFAFCRPATCANRSPTWCSSIMASNSTGTSSWRSRRAPPSRPGSENSASSAGPPGWRRTGRSMEATRRDARFHPAERMRSQARAGRTRVAGEGDADGRYQP